MNLFVWRNFDHSEASIINNNLCVLLNPGNEPAFFYFPIGEKKIRETVEICLNYAPRLSRVPEFFINKYGPFTISCDRGNFDYVYLTSELVKLKGKDFDAKRNFIKRFTKKNNYKYHRISKKDGPACLETLKKWEAQKKYLTPFTIRSQEGALVELFKVYEKLDVFGGAISINNKIEAFAIASRLNSETADVHFEIASPNFTGIFQTINNLFVENELSGFKYVNREQDMGLPGLRKAKLSYHPHHLEQKFDLTSIIRV